MLLSNRRKLNKSKLLRLLDELETAAGSGTSLYVLPGAPEDEIQKTLDVAVGAEEVISDIIRDAARSTTGAVLFWGERGKYLILPPFPVAEKAFVSGFDVKPLRLMLTKELMIALVLLRLGAYAIGVFQEQILLASKVGTGNIHSRHRKGGSSERRFARHREKEMEYFFTRVCGRVQERLEPYIERLDYLVYGGERHTLLAFRKRCEFLKRLDDRALVPLINVREPKQATLEAAIEQVWSSEVIQWHDEGADII
ncbi:MAG: hypothetical protein MUP21_11555 [Dehalococcoidia bacterium]|nr:hypothetical protein [Dehalococcoidia bacterium]